MGMEHFSLLSGLWSIKANIILKITSPQREKCLLSLENIYMEVSDTELLILYWEEMYSATKRKPLLKSLKNGECKCKLWGQMNHSLNESTV